MILITDSGLGSCIEMASADQKPNTLKTVQEGSRLQATNLRRHAFSATRLPRELEDARA